MRKSTFIPKSTSCWTAIYCSNRASSTTLALAVEQHSPKKLQINITPLNWGCDCGLLYLLISSQSVNKFCVNGNTTVIRSPQCLFFPVSFICDAQAVIDTGFCSWCFYLLCLIDAKIQTLLALFANYQHLSCVNREAPSIISFILYGAHLQWSRQGFRVGSSCQVKTNLGIFWSENYLNYQCRLSSTWRYGKSDEEICIAAAKTVA